MSMYELSSILWRRKLVVAVVALFLIGVGTVTVFSRVDGKRYTSSSRVMMDQPALVGTADGAAVPTKLGALLPTMCALLSGDEGVQQVADTTGESAGAVRAVVRCTPLPNTTIAEVRVTTSNPRRSERMSSAAADVLVAQVVQRYQTSTVSSVDHIDASVLVSARRPAADSNHVLRQLGLVVVGGLVLAAAFAVAAEPHRRDAISFAIVDPAPAA
jgi:capsular polysaccharide biosynthesis protein